MKKYIIMLTLLISICITGFKFDSNSQQLTITGENIIGDLAQSDLNYVGISDSDDFIQANAYLYTDNLYNYYVDMDEQYLSNIIPSYGNNPAMPVNNIMTTESAQNIALEYFNTALGTFIEGELSVSSQQCEGLGYVFEIIEILNNFETGTKASIITSLDGTLICASFIKGTPALVRNLSLDDLIANTQAISIATTVLEQEDFSVNVENLESELKTFNNVIYWYITIPVEAYLNSTNASAINYYFSVDAKTGEIVEIAHDVY